jgi:O-antigen/teichoic acid export membrane protein
VNTPRAAAVTTAAPAATTDSQLRPILLNGAALLGAYVLPRALTFGAALVAARTLGPAQFGVYGAAASCAMILSIFTTLGMLPLLVRELARAPERAGPLIAAATRVKLGGAVVMVGIALLVCPLVLSYSVQATLAVIILALGWTAWGLAENIGAWYQAREEMQVWFRANTLFGVVAGALGIAAVAITRNVLWFCAAFAGGQLAAFLWLRTRSPVVSADTADMLAVRRLVRETMPFASAFLLLTIFYKFDVILLQQLQTSTVAGIYAAGYKLVDVVHALAVVAAAAVYPRLARSFRDDRGHGAAASRTLELFVLGGVPAAAAVFLLRDPLTSMFFGDAYATTSQVLAWLAPAMCVLVINILGGYLLSAAHRVDALAACYAGAFALKFLLVWWWAPFFGARGTAAAMLIAELALGGALLTVMWRARIASLSQRTIALAAGAVLCAAAAALLLQSAPLTAVFSCAVAMIAIYTFGGAVTGAERDAVVAALSPFARRGA